jgi:F420-dependent methylenetetrahydromethanopterin dehydrogenase
MPTPVKTAMKSAAPGPMKRRTVCNGSNTGCPPMIIVRLAGKAARDARFRARNDPYRIINVTAVNAAQTAHRRLRVFQNTSP